ncbi:MAG: hypothetical protein OXB88_11425 [Bacteriovoracales bacterium]|nr:hypothetical protein [Bacteriovoracales bacterium]
MSNNKLSDVAIEYALHINQIQKAREIFERECNGFMNDLCCYLNRKFTELYDKDCKLYLAINEDLKISPSGHAKSYYSICKYPIKMKSGKSKNSRYETLGYFQTGIEFDTFFQTFCWITKFHNNDTFDPQFDERMMTKIKKFDQEEQDRLFVNFGQINFDGLYFSKKLIDDKFDFDFKVSIDPIIKILLSTIIESENFINVLGKSEHNKIVKVAKLDMEPPLQNIKKAL